jgi:hypothetical protein
MGCGAHHRLAPALPSTWHPSGTLHSHVPGFSSAGLLAIDPADKY